MRIWFMFPAVVLFCLLAANLHLAQADSITLKDGHMLIGDIVKTTNDSLTFKYQAGDDDEKTVTFRAEDLDPHSFYAARSEDLPEDPEAYISLAKYCAENRMFSRCMVTYEQARAKFPEVIQQAIGEEPQAGALEALKRRPVVKHTVPAEKAAIQEFIRKYAA